MKPLLDSPDLVVRALLTYTDWWQPATGSILTVARSGGEAGDGFRSGLIDSLDVRDELRRRVGMLPERDRQLLFLWYVAQLPVEEIARAVGVSRRHCFRVRSKAIRMIVELGDADAA